MQDLPSDGLEHGTTPATDAAPLNPAGTGLPAIQQPTGGGAIRGIDETFTANPATGTASLGVPIYTSPGRAGFGPTLSLQYNSGLGNSPFGLGWSLDVPRISRKTDKGVPRYLDADHSDTFVLSGAEDLVWVPDAGAGFQVRTVNGKDFHVYRYQPRVEGAFARIERWLAVESGEAHWRSITRDNITNIYGKSPLARIAHPQREEDVFTWLLEETRDPLGQCIVYTYKAEDLVGVDPDRASEQHRFAADAAPRQAQRYLKRVQYGNQTPNDTSAFHFELVFDYGEHTDASRLHEAVSPWTVRDDPFSTYRAGFEVRTWRLARRALMFHRFAKLDAAPYVVHSTEFSHVSASAAAVPPPDTETQAGWPQADTGFSYLMSVGQSGWHKRDDGIFEVAETLPPLAFSYQVARLDLAARPLDPTALEGMPDGPAEGVHTFVDLDGEGLPGVLTRAGTQWRYKPNLGGGRFAAPQVLATAPNTGNQAQLLDLAGDGRKDLAVLAPPGAGFYERTRDGKGWHGFVPFESAQNIDFDDPNLRMLDLDGDGLADALVTEQDAFVWYRSKGEQGFEDGWRVPRGSHADKDPTVVFSDASETIFLADMSGDGLTDIVRVRRCDVSYWPNLGLGRFGRRVVMDNAPCLADVDGFDPRRIRFADVDGSGTSDLVYLAADHIAVYCNQSGNGLAHALILDGLPADDGLRTVQVADLFGRGTSCFIWSSARLGGAPTQAWMVEPSAGHKPHLLRTIDNSLGTTTTLAYAPSTEFYLRDREAGRDWITRLHFPVWTLESVARVDHVAGTTLHSRYAYHHGHFDPYEREFRGFAFVEQWDAESFVGDPKVDADGAVLTRPPVLSRTWFHTGAWLEDALLEHGLQVDYYKGDPRWAELLLDDTVLADGLDPTAEREAMRALRGKVLRQEVFALDGSPLEAHPYTVTETNHAVVALQMPQEGRMGVFLTHPRESVVVHYERRSDDPRIGHTLVTRVDDWGNIEESVEIGYPRRGPATQHEPEQHALWALRSTATFINAEHDDWRWVGVNAEAQQFELLGLGSRDRRYTFEEVVAHVALAVANEVDYIDTANTPGLRRIEHQRQLFYNNALDAPLDLEHIASHGIGYASYRRAFAASMVPLIHDGDVDAAMLVEGGYKRGHEIPGVPADDDWWAPSGRATFDDGLLAAAQRFYRPTQMVDPFGNSTTVAYDATHLFPVHFRDPVGNVTRVVHEVDTPAQADMLWRETYRHLQPAQVCDPNLNRVAIQLNALGMLEATALMGQRGQGEGDDLANPTVGYSYDLFAWSRDGTPVWTEVQAREQFGDPNSRMQRKRVYTDGSGRVAQTVQRVALGEIPKVVNNQIERDASGAPVMIASPTGERWVASGRTVFDNKGNPVKQYEPFFQDGPHWQPEEGIARWGRTPVMHYDPLGRLVRRDVPDGTFTETVFDAWAQRASDANDTVRSSEWYASRGAPAATQDSAAESDPERRAAILAARHANTPLQTQLDSLGRPFLTLESERSDRVFETRTVLDIEGHTLAVICSLDPYVAPAPSRPEPALGRRRFVVQGHRYDLLGRPFERTSPDAGTRTVLMDVAGEPIRSWDARGNMHRLEFDGLRRLTHQWVTESAVERLRQRTIYGESAANPEQHNLREKVVCALDGAGIAVSGHYHFSGTLEVATRHLTAGAAVPDWAPVAASAASNVVADAAAMLDDTVGPFTNQSRTNALGQLVIEAAPDGTVTRYRYDDSGALRAQDLWPLADLTAVADLWDLVDDATANRWTPTITSITYNTRGQRNVIVYGNGTETHSRYDEDTFRLRHQLSFRTAQPNKPLQNVWYTYDPVGNIVEQRKDLRSRYDHSGQVTGTYPGNSWSLLFNTLPDANRCRYRYDARYRLVWARGRELPVGRLPSPGGDTPYDALPHPNDMQALVGYAQRFAYDAMGNILSIQHTSDRGQPGDHWTRNYTYAYDNLAEAPSSRLWQTNNSRGTVPRIYRHDANGNMDRMPHLPTMSWDHGDRLIAVDRLGGGQVEMTYDAGGQRVRKLWTHSGGVDERIYLGNLEIYRRHIGAVGNAPQFVRHTHHTSDGNARIALTETVVRTGGADVAGPVSGHFYQLADHLGSAVVETNANGIPQSYEELHPYGTSAFQAAIGNRQSESRKRYRFNGKERDAETGFDYFGARYYAPWLGRWCSADPAGLVDGPSTFSAFANDPVNRRDPTGMATVDANLNDVVNYRDKVANRASLGQNVQKDHIIAQEKIRIVRTDSAGKTHYRPGADPAVVVETGKATSNSAAKPHTLKTFHVDQNDVDEIARLRQNGIGHVTTDIVDPSRSAAISAGMRPESVDRALLGQLNNLHSSQTLSESGRTANNAVEAFDDIDWDATFDEGPSTPKAGPVADTTAQTAKKTGRVKGFFKKTLKSIADNPKVAKAGAKLAKAGKQFSKAVPFLGTGAGVAGAAYAASQGDRVGAALDTVGLVPVAGDLVDAGRGGYALGEAANELLVDSDTAMSHGEMASGLAKKVGLGDTASTVVGGAAAAMSAIGQVALKATPFGLFF